MSYAVVETPSETNVDDFDLDIGMDSWIFDGYLLWPLKDVYKHINKKSAPNPSWKKYTKFTVLKRNIGNEINTIIRCLERFRKI